MTPVMWMTAICGLSWAAVSIASSNGANPEALAGMAGPLAAAVTSWTVVDRTHAAAPERVTGVMVTGFALKALFFAAYVVVMLKALELRPMPFAVSLTGYFVGLYALEALFLQRLFATGPRRPR